MVEKLPIPTKLKVSKSVEAIEHKFKSVKEFMENLDKDLRDEIERITKEEKMIGEGKTARVFNIETKRTACPVCVKIFRPELKNRSPHEYKKIQYLTPEEEFNLQDTLYLNGFKNIPRAIAYSEAEGYKFFTMEQIKGYTLEEIERSNAIISNPGWKELENLIKELNINQKIIHRDIHARNIMLETSQTLEDEDMELEGKLYLIDFGLSKKITTTPPNKNDYLLTIGQNVIRYPEDKSSVDGLEPRRGRKIFKNIA